MGLFSKKEPVKEEAATTPATITTSTDVESERHSLNEIVLESINEGVMIVDQKGNIQLVNPAACKMIGRDADELLHVSHDAVITLLDKTGNR